MTDENDDRQLYINWVRLLAHDLRAPLATLSSSIGFMEQQQNSLQSVYLLGAARDAVLRLSRTIDNIEVRGQLLDSVPPVLEPVDVSALVRTIVAEAAISIAAREVNLVLEIPSQPIIMDSDSQVLRIIIANGLFNAIESSPLNGSIKLKIATDQQFLHFSFSDEGIAIPEEVSKLALDDFGQIKLRQRGMRIGRGMALVAVRLAAEALKGGVLLGRAGDRGCILSICLPVITGKTPAEA